MTESKKVTLRAMMTAARYEGSWCRTQIENSLKQLGVPLVVSNGVFYGQCMQKMMEDAVADSVQYIVTIDGDTVFKPEQLHRLISIVVQEDLDALCGYQLRRGKPDMLGAKFGNNKQDWTGYPIQLDSAHFGLTVIDAKKLANVPKPWFFCQPDENGSWGDNRVDSDCWFWKQWREAGLRIHCDPDCRIGHVEEMVAIYEYDNGVMRPTHMYPAQWSQADVSPVTEAVEAV